MPVAIATLSLSLSACAGDQQMTQVELVPGLAAEVDLDGDGSPETVLFDSGDATIFIEDGFVTYRSRTRWTVVQAALGDLDGNGLPEVVALLDSEVGRHIALFAYFGGEYRERLVTQAIDPAPLSFQIATSAGDVLRLQQASADSNGAPQTIVLRWNGFGFTRIE